MSVFRTILSRLFTIRKKREPSIDSDEEFIPEKKRNPKQSKRSGKLRKEGKEAPPVQYSQNLKPETSKILRDK